jgi:hypothetical protein
VSSVKDQEGQAVKANGTEHGTEHGTGLRTGLRTPRRLELSRTSFGASDAFLMDLHKGMGVPGWV